MDELSREYVISFYNNMLKMHGDRPEALRWTPGGQQLHYNPKIEIELQDVIKPIYYSKRIKYFYIVIASDQRERGNLAF